MKRIYLDNAATSWPKPAPVAEAMLRYLTENGAPAGRSGYAEANAAQRLVDDCRRRLAQLVGADHPRRIAMAFNGTDALNMALHGLLRAGDHVVTTVWEHNSVLRPLAHLARHGGVEVTYLEGNGFAVNDDEVAAAMRDETRLVAITHVSNVTGAIQPVHKIGRQVAEHPRALLLVDAAQSLGHLPIDVVDLGADLLAAPGHKGLRGPLGTGLLYVGPRAEPQLQSWRQGGTGTQSEEPMQPEALPERLEAGNLNMPGIAGLAAAVALLSTEQLAAAAEHERRLTERLLTGLAELPDVQVHGPADPSSALRTSVVSITSTLLPPQELAALLDASFRIQTRAGLHCAPLAHRKLNTLSQGGTLRFSPGPETKLEEIDYALQALRELHGA
ncbi:MAG: aminotransferase class V-fold PLP-dependent enzyme [Planctomycetales bacterium]|nr:aminotransferase class V-fold PLP-dependent enzyme [Planctomycetales bacterium]